FSLVVNLYQTPSAIQTALNDEWLRYVSIPARMTGSIEACIYRIESHIVIIISGGFIPFPITEYFQSAVCRKIQSISLPCISHSMNVFYLAIKICFKVS